MTENNFYQIISLRRILDGDQDTAADLLSSIIQTLLRGWTRLAEVKHQGELKHQHSEPLAGGRPLHPTIY
jgi:hypothetical protein